ncbi:MAG: EAL domain-containing protein [Lachnospiraceae bacterium]|nr:EAL domain-containing protein [Lachnospiraceae bacterium]
MSDPKFKNIHKKENEKLYKKVKHISSFGSITMYLFLSILFCVMAVILAGFILEYIIETKFTEAYTDLKYVSELYELGNTDNTVMDYLRSDGRDFIVTDSSGKVVYQIGENTISDISGDIIFSNSTETYTVYADSESGYLYPNNGHLGVDFMRLRDSLEMDVENIELPLWLSIDINGGDRKLVGKTLFSFSKRDAILAIELTIGIGVITLIMFLIFFIYLIRSIVNYKRVVKLFYSDPVTSGHNWVWYVRNGNERLRKASSKASAFAVVDVVFKNYRNYCLCHSISEGEAFLSKIYTILSAEIKRGEICAHSTTAVFALLLRYDSEEQLRSRLNDILQKLRNMDKEHNHVFQMGVNLLEPVTDENGKPLKRKKISIENEYNNAAAASATLESSDACEIRFFDSNLLEEQRWSDSVHERQMSALDNEEFVVYYQPKYDPKTSILRGAEALVRWDSPDLGFVSPGRFIPIFEKNGFITRLDHYMIAHVARDQKSWLDAGYKCVPVSVNVSRAHFSENDLAEQIRDIVDKAECPHDLIEIELTESAFFDDKHAMIETIGRLKSYGFAVSMDDFGAGYSSLNSLKDMSLDVLKLDADFFRGENADERGQIVISEAIRLAKNLNMRIVAEGVEEKEQVDFLADQDCDMIQGYYFAKPMPKSEYLSRIAVSEA